MKKLLYGKDNEENIVAVEPVSGKPLVHVFKRENGIVVDRYERTEFFFYTTKEEAVKLKEKECKVFSALGGNFYNRLVTTSDPQLVYKAKDLDAVVPYHGSQYLLQTGKTLFKGMEFNDPLVLFFDLEVYTTPGYDFVNSSRNTDTIIIAAVRTNHGYEKVIHSENEEEVIVELIETIREQDPDVIANHNIFNFDLSYLYDRCQLHNIPLAIGRDGSEPRKFETKIKFADREKEYTNFAIYGRNVIDTMFLAEYADVVLRNMPSYNLKELVKYLGKASEDRVYVEGNKISWYWDNDRQALLDYALDDVREAEILYNEFGQAIFTTTKMVPMSYQEVFRYGTGNQIEYIFMREYRDMSYSYPKRDEARKYSGGYADVLEFGFINEPVIYADVESLYPNLGRLLKIQPKKDELEVYQRLLNLMIDTRIEIKKMIKTLKDQGKDEEARIQKSYDGSVKILLNTMSYGFIGWAWGSFNDYDEAERITKAGQDIVKKMIEICIADGGKPIKVDTDGVALVPPKEYQGSEEKELAYCKRLTDAMPEGIKIGLDGRYKGIIAFDAKSYALWEYNDKITIKGNTLRGRSVESFGTQFIKDCVEDLFRNEGVNCRKIYDHYHKLIQEKKMPPELINKRSNLNMSIEEYKNRTESGNTNKIAQYELAINAKRKYGKGDVVVYYVRDPGKEIRTVRNKVVLRKRKLPAFESSKLIEDFDNDYDVDYYLGRLEKIAKKFVILKDRFEKLFNIEVKNADKLKYKKITDKEY